MATTASSNKPTPNGGVRSEAYFKDDNGNPADQSVATAMEIVEYDAQDNVINRTYGTIERD